MGRGDHQTGEAAEVQQAVLQDVISGDVEAFCKTLAAHGQSKATALRYLMDWFHQWQQEYEAFVEVLETEEVRAEAEAEEDEEEEAITKKEEAEVDAAVVAAVDGEDGKLETITKDLEELEVEAEDVLGGVRVLAIELLENEATEAPAKLVDRYGWTLLMQAANSGLRDLLQVLIEEHHADVNASGTTSNGLTPLYLAVSSEHAEEALLLLQHGAIASATRVVETPVEEEEEDDAETEEEKPVETEEDCAWFEACRQGLVTVVSDMIARGVDVNFALPSTGDSALHVAVMFAMQDVVEQLIADANINVNAINASGQTCLFGCSDVEVAHFLIDHGVDPRIVDSDGETAYSVAKELGDDEVAAFLAPLSTE